jgi:hypothetical protein
MGKPGFHVAGLKKILMLRLYFSPSDFDEIQLLVDKVFTSCQTGPSLRWFLKFFLP